MPEERRVVTVLFADVTGSTTLGEELDPEEMRALLIRYYAIAKDVVAEHGGTIEKFIGDAVMAVFGLPLAHGDDAKRALFAALSLRDQVRADPRLGDRFPIRCGVNTGEVVAMRGSDAADFLVTGDAVNVAARLQQFAEPWGVLCGERTARAARESFSFGQAVAIDAKGKRRPIAAHPVSGPLSVPRMRVPLLGRDADLDQIEFVARRTFSERRPFLVSLVGPAGEGKTRLLEEFLDRLPATQPDARVAVAQSMPYGNRLTYWPMRAVLHTLVGASDDSSPAEMRERIVMWLRENAVEPADATASLLASTIGVGEGDVSDRGALFVAWRNAIELAARRQPLVLVFEDLHWSTDSQLDLVEFVMQPRGDAPILMIVLTRPELLDRRPKWAGGRLNHLALSLEPLGAEAVAGIVTHLLPLARSDIVERIVARAEGNPFFAGELVRALVERAGRPSDPAADAALASLPDTVQATILARLDLLPAAERRVLQLGSVFGRAFRPEGLRALAPNIGAAEAACERLAEKDLVRPLEADAYAFRHILIREVAYGTLPRADRVELHARAGAWLEAQAAEREDALAELIAYHYREAAQLVSRGTDPALSEQMKRNAVRWLRRAADVAIAAAASLEASRHLRAAIELAERSERPELYLSLGELLPSGAESLEAYRTARQLCRELDRPADDELRALAGLLHVLMRFETSIGDRPTREELDALRSDAAALVPFARNERTLARFLIADAFYPNWLREDKLAEERKAAERSARAGLAIAERLDDAPLQSAALDGLGSHAGERGAWRESREINRRRLAMHDRLDMNERLDAYSMVTWASVYIGDLDEAARVSAEGIAIIQPGQAPAWTIHLTSWRAYALLMRGDWDEVASLGERMYALWEEIGRSSVGYGIAGFLAALEVARERDDTERADRASEAITSITSAFPADSPSGLLNPAFLRRDHPGLVAALERELAVESPNIRQVQRLERALALCADDGYRIEPALVTRAVEYACRFEYVPLEAQARRALGAAVGDPEELAAALARFERMGAVPYSARARCEHALLVGDRGAFDDGARALERLGDVAQLRRYRERRRGA